MAANTVKVAGKMYLCTKITAIFYYLQKDSGMELDFLIRYKGECVPVEVKAKTAQAKSIATVRKHPEKYGVKHFSLAGLLNKTRAFVEQQRILRITRIKQMIIDNKDSGGWQLL